MGKAKAAIKAKSKPTDKAKAKPKHAGKPAGKKAAAKPVANKTRAARVPFASTSGRACYQHFEPEASALQGEIPVARFDVTIARGNVDAAVKEVRPHLDAIVREAPGTDTVAILELPARAAALEYAASLVPAEARSDESIDALVGELSPLRLDTLAFLEIAGRRKLVDPARVAAVREGHGKLDFARDCVAIAGIFADAADALTGKHPFEQAEIDRLGEGGETLRQQLTPGGAPRRPRDRDPAAILRDKFAKVLDDGYALLEKAAVVKWGVAGLRAHVPPLLSRTHAAAKAAAPVTTSPPATSPPAPVVAPAAAPPATTDETPTSE